MIDVLIIGAGITGTTLARELSKYDMKVTVLDIIATTSLEH